MAVLQFPWKLSLQGGLIALQGKGCCSSGRVAWRHWPRRESRPSHPSSAAAAHLAWAVRTLMKEGWLGHAASGPAGTALGRTKRQNRCSEHNLCRLRNIELLAPCSLLFLGVGWALTYPPLREGSCRSSSYLTEGFSFKSQPLSTSLLSPPLSFLSLNLLHFCC